MSRKSLIVSAWMEEPVRVSIAPVLILVALFGTMRPVAGVNTTGYEVTMSFPSMYAPGTTWMIKQAFFAKQEMGYTIVFCAPEDKFLVH